MSFLMLLRLCRLASALIILISLCNTSLAQERAISPWKATIKSAIIPGWGQLITGSRVKAAISLASVYGLVAASLIVRASYLNIYNNKYVPMALSGSPESERYYNLANQRYKLSKGLAFTAVGVWAYSMIDSYVSCIIRNTQIKAQKLKFDTERIDKFDLEYKALEGEFKIEAKTEF